MLARAASYDEVAVWGQFDTREEAVALVSAETRAVASASAEARAEATRVEAVPLVKGVAVSWAPCKREGCKCSASFNGLPDEFCCFTCQGGRPCTRNIHQAPVRPAEGVRSSLGVVAPCKREGCPCTSSFSGRPNEFCCFTCQGGRPCFSRNIHRAPVQPAGGGGPQQGVEAPAAGGGGPQQSGAAPAFAKGSTTKQTHIQEKLAEGRLEMVRKCIRRECGYDHTDGSATACRGGCGTTLHV